MGRNLSLILVVIWILLFFSSRGQAQVWSGVVAANRVIDWSQSGVPGGIPTRTDVCAKLDASSFGNGSADATASIQAALGSCGANQVVSLSAGTFRINGNVQVPSNVTLRGAGAGTTVLSAYGSKGAVIELGSFGDAPSAGSSVTITGGATSGSNSIAISNPAGIAVGSYLLVTELNDPSYVTITTPNGTCTWCDSSMWGGARVRGQIVEVASVSGSTVGIKPPLYTAYGVAPGTGPALATPFRASAKWAGVEDLQVYANNTGYQTNFALTQCAYCWIKGVEGNYADGDHVEVQFSYRGEVRDSYFSNAYVHSPGSTDADVMLAGKTSGTLVENNILERLHTSIMLNWGAAGNVIAYNYSVGSFDASATNAVMIDFAVHGAHPQFNLWEGNVAPHLFPDSFWGTGAYNTAFRNWWTGTTLVAPPYSGRGVINWAGGHLATQQNRGITLNFSHTRYNLIGNVSGSAAAGTASGGNLFNGGLAGCPSCAVPPANRSYSGVFYAFDFGYDTGSDSSGSGIPSLFAGVSYLTTFMHGNYDIASRAVAWDLHGTGSHTLPASFYRSAKPSWFGNVPWPPIGPDVNGGIDVGGHVYANPAQACYDRTGKDSTGMLAFNPGSCYGTSSESRPAPPTNLSVTVQ